MQHLFVYGTLAPGRENDHELRGIPGSWHVASLRGALLADGWGAAQGYPGIVPNQAEAPVQGVLFSSTQLHHHWQRLDAFEGPGYQRIEVLVDVQSGFSLAAFVYALQPRPE
ncbi:MAG: gamma-glutamylcyclotransferase family protein [Pseudomonadota bacterium]